MSRLAGSTPSIEKPEGYRGVVALSPVAPLVADIGKSGDNLVLRITNYQTSVVVAHTVLHFLPYTLAFSPDGKSLLARRFSDIQLFVFGDSKRIYGRFFSCHGEDASHYQGKATVPKHIPMTTVLHLTWLDGQNVLVAGAIGNEPCAAIFNAEQGNINIVPLTDSPSFGKFNNDHIQRAFCSHLGLIAFAVENGKRVLLYELDEERNGAWLKSSFHVFDVENVLDLLMDEHRILHRCKYSFSWLSYKSSIVNLFDFDGQPLDREKLSDDENIFAYRHKALCCLQPLKYSSEEVKCDAHIYSVRDNKLKHWCIITGAARWQTYRSYYWGKTSVDIAMHHEKIFVAFEVEDKTEVYELDDFDILQLSSDDPMQRLDAAERLGKRRFQEAVPMLARILADKDSKVQIAAVDALAEIGSVDALRHLIRELGRRLTNSDDTLCIHIVSVLRRCPQHWLREIALDCNTNPGLAFRRGAARVLEEFPSIEALNELCDAIHDSDSIIRHCVAHALEKRADIRASIALLSHLNDEDEPAREAAQRALIRILQENGLLRSSVREQLSIPLKAFAYAEKVISTGCMKEFENVEPLPVGAFLVDLVTTCIQINQPLPKLLNALEMLATKKAPTEYISTSIGLTIALICADSLKKQNRWNEAADVYRSVVLLAQNIDAPQMEWRAWLAIGVCFEVLKNDPAALNAFRRSVDIIDRLWFDLLEEDKLRDFFQDKALLYDHAELCALRLGHRELALEFCEKGKTRYLGDLIARRQMNPREILNRDMRSVWENIGHVRTFRAAVVASQTSSKRQVEVVAAQWGTIEAGSNTVKLEHLTAFEEAALNSEWLQERTYIVREVWRLMAYLSTFDDILNRDYLEGIYEALLPIHQAVKAMALPVSEIEHQQSFQQYEAAAEQLSLDNSGEQGVPFWIFREAGLNWIRQICNSTSADENALLLEAVMEALNIVLHHEPIIATTGEPSEREIEGPIFVTRILDDSPASPSHGTTPIDTLLEQQQQTRWRYLTQIARGEISTYRDIADALYGQSGVAQIQFSVTENGTIIYVIHGGMGPSTGIIPLLHGENRLYVFTCPEVNLSSLHQQMMDIENGWFIQYRNYREEGNQKNFKAWQETMDRVLQWLYSELIVPLDAHLKHAKVKHLHIIPHRALHLIPFSALYRIDKNKQPHYLVDDYDIDYAPSATLQQICKKRAERSTLQESLLAIANPTLDLPFASFEVEQAIKYFPSQDIQFMLEGEALLEDVKAVLPKSVFHFAGHGDYNWADPLESRLSFANEEYLHLADLYAEELQLPGAGLVVLSACETAITDPEDLADEFLGLASGFLFEGTSAVISTLWTVMDLSTSLLIAYFYRKHFKEHLSPARALRKAQVWVSRLSGKEVVQYIEQLYQHAHGKDKNQLFGYMRHYRYRVEQNPAWRPFEHPYYWAAFTVNGM